MTPTNISDRIKLLNLEQRLAFEMVKSKKNVFITGGGGVGKSFLIDVLSAHFKKMVVLAPTGIAALNVSGETVHSFFKISFGKSSHTLDLSFMAKLRRGDKKRLSSADIILIDEVSMCRCDIIDIIDQKLRIATGNNKPFGGKQIVFVGDFAQIEPVAKQGEEIKALQMLYGNNFYAFNSNAWKELKPIPLVLTEPVRHNEIEFIQALRNIRMGVKLKEAVDFLNQRVSSDYTMDDVRLVTTNSQCDRYNEDRYEHLDGEEVVYNASITGLYKERPSPEELFLKVGARVIFTANSKEEGLYVNGDIGEVIKLETDSIQVKLDRGSVISVQKYKFESIAYEPSKTISGMLEKVTIGTYEQMPLKLAYGLTVHKSQGATLDRCVVDFSNGTFAYGQCYVALSRVRTLAGLFLVRPLRISDIKVNPFAVEYTKACSIEALNRRESDLKKYNLDPNNFKEKPVSEPEKEKSVDENIIDSLRLIIENQIVEKSLRQSLEAFEMVGVTTYLEMDELNIKSGGFSFKGKKYSCDDVFNKNIKNWFIAKKITTVREIEPSMKEYVEFLNDRTKDIPLYTSNKETNKAVVDIEMLDTLILKIKNDVMTGKLSIEKLKGILA